MRYERNADICVILRLSGTETKPMKRVLLFTLCLLLQFLLQRPGYAQGGKTLQISGSIIDEDNNAIPFANAAVYSNLDSALVGGAASDEKGNFTVDIKPGNYYVRAWKEYVSLASDCS